MRIIFAGDEHPYSAFALKEVARLAMHTWADVTLLGVLPELPFREGADSPPWPLNHPLNLALKSYREDFLKSWGKEESPYAPKKCEHAWLPLRDGGWNEMLVCRGDKKDLQVRLRVGTVSAEILAETKKGGGDLLVVGCTKGEQCLWQNALPVPQRVVNDADCSVLLVKEGQPITRILACLDQSYISQESLEMINQMVTIHGAKLELIGLSQEGSMKKEVYTRLIEIGDYYSDRQVKVTTRLTAIAEFEDFIAREVGQDLLALWMGKKSLLRRFFPRDWVGRIVGKCQTSVLVLR